MAAVLIVEIVPSSMKALHPNCLSNIVDPKDNNLEYEV